MFDNVTDLAAIRGKLVAYECFEFADSPGEAMVAGAEKCVGAGSHYRRFADTRRKIRASHDETKRPSELSSSRCVAA